jgi:hypothetical protein
MKAESTFQTGIPFRHDHLLIIFIATISQLQTIRRLPLTPLLLQRFLSVACLTHDPPTPQSSSGCENRHLSCCSFEIIEKAREEGGRDDEEEITNKFGVLPRSLLPPLFKIDANEKTRGGGG